MSTLTTPFTGTYKVDAAHSSIEFAVTHMGASTFRATFDDLSGQLVAGDDGVHLTGTAKAESVSIRTPEDFRDHVVFGGDFFDANQHPTLTATSSDVQFRQDGTVTVDGELTIRGITQPVTATGTYRGPVETPFGTTVAAVELTATVDRRDWGLNWQMELPGGGDALSYEVELRASLELIRES